ncbi:MAG: hypothetical protein HYW65_04345 [Candidatus Liptonbacteria bacterium]|nr:hypothetical protein [Candidatus Liptonbacteria bacterium]
MSIAGMSHAHACSLQDVSECGGTRPARRVGRRGEPCLPAGLRQPAADSVPANCMREHKQTPRPDFGRGGGFSGSSPPLDEKPTGSSSRC